MNRKKGEKRACTLFSLKFYDGRRLETQFLVAQFLILTNLVAVESGSFPTILVVKRSPHQSTNQPVSSKFGVSIVSGPFTFYLKKKKNYGSFSRIVQAISEREKKHSQDVKFC